MTLETIEEAHPLECCGSTWWLWLSDGSHHGFSLHSQVVLSKLSAKRRGVWGWLISEVIQESTWINTATRKLNIKHFFYLRPVGNFVTGNRTGDDGRISGIQKVRGSRITHRKPVHTVFVHHKTNVAPEENALPLSHPVWTTNGRQNTSENGCPIEIQVETSMDAETTLKLDIPKHAHRFLYNISYQNYWKANRKWKMAYPM